MHPTAWRAPPKLITRGLRSPRPAPTAPRFNPDQDISKKETLKSSVARKFKKDLAENYPSVEGNIEEWFPKKDSMIVHKTKEKMEFLVVKGEICFFRTRDGGPFLPTLRLLHKCRSPSHLRPS